MRYPAEPWHLRGSSVISVFRVPRRLVPGEHLPVGARVITVAGNALVAVAFVSYEPGSVLTYEELLVATPVRDQARTAVSVPQIWVDSEASRQGGRELWAIPKQLAEFGQGSSIAGVAVTGGVPLPGRWTTAGWTAQRLDGRDVRARIRMSGRYRLVRAAWMFPVGGPLGYLTGRTPLVSLAARDLELTFGQAR